MALFGPRAVSDLSLQCAAKQTLTVLLSHRQDMPARAARPGRNPMLSLGVVVAAMEFCEERDNPRRGYAV